MSGVVHKVDLRSDQLDLIVLALKHIRGMAHGSVESGYSVDRLGRLFLKRRCDEAIADIQNQASEVGNDAS